MNQHNLNHLLLLVQMDGGSHILRSLEVREAADRKADVFIDVKVVTSESH